MMICFTLFMIPLLLTLMIMLIISFLYKKSVTDREKNSPFECGFDPKNSARLPFSLQFFLITIIFLIFDVEIVLLLPSILTFPFSSLIIWSLTLWFFIMILLMGLYHEWFHGALQWSF